MHCRSQNQRYTMENIVKSGMMNMPKKRRHWVMEQAVYTLYPELFAFPDDSEYYQSHITEVLYHTECEMSWNQWKALHTKSQTVIFPGLFSRRKRWSVMFLSNWISKSTTLDTLMTPETPLVIINFGRGWKWLRRGKIYEKIPKKRDPFLISWSGFREFL